MTFSRRRRQVAIVSALGVLFLAGAAAVVLSSRSDRTYIPGGEIEGLTARLARGLPEDYPRVTFEDVTTQAGIAFQHFQSRRSIQLPEDMGSGAAWGDYDEDGWPDLFIVNTTGPLTLSDAERAASPASSKLYRNRGDGTFEDVTDKAGVAYRGIGMGAAWGDYDNDGREDLFVTSYGANVLYRNNGDGTFTDVSGPAGIARHVGFWAGVSWADYDRDGFLDAYVTGYVKYTPGAGATARQYDIEVPTSLNPSSFRPERNLLFHNRGDGTFSEVAERAGVDGREGRGLSAAWTDLDEDGWPDLYVANDVSDNALYRNQGDGTFRDVSHAALVADYRGAMGIAVGDWDGDEDTDLFITHWIAQENALFSSQLSTRREVRPSPATGGEGTAGDRLRFMDEADRHGLGQIALDYVGWGTSFIDYDNDGRLDLLVVNGSTFQQTERPELLVPMRDQLFWNRGPADGFFDVSAVAGEYFTRELVGRGAAFADYDNDGDVDAFIVNNGGPGVLLRNDGGNRRPSLSVRLAGDRSNRSAIGARLRLTSGGTVQTREVGAQSSYLSQNSPVVHFGLGDAAAVDSLEILWPSGERQLLTALPAGRLLHVREGRAPEPVDLPEVATAGVVEEDREAVLRFWERLRAATRERIEGRPTAAAAAYRAALDLRPDHEDALYYLGATLLELGDVGGAGESWERLVRVNPASARGHVQLGILSACPAAGARFDLERAEAELSRAQEINPEQTGPLLWLAKVALLRRRPAEARSRVEAVLATNPESTEGRYLLAFLAWTEGARELAVEEFAAAARSARAVAPAAERGLREGDTEAGRAMVSDVRPCREIELLVGELASVDPEAASSRLATAMEASFARLIELLQAAAS